MKKGQQFLSDLGLGVPLNMTYLGLIEGKYQFSIRNEQGVNIGSGALTKEDLSKAPLTEIKKGHPRYLPSDPLADIFSLFKRAEKLPEDKQMDAVMTGLTKMQFPKPAK